MNNAQIIEAIRTGTVLVAGAGVSGRGAAQMLQHLGCQHIVIVDDNETAGTQLAEDLSVSWRDTAQAQELFDGHEDSQPAVSLVVTSPGWRPDSSLFATADRASVPVVGEVAVAFAADRLGIWGKPRIWLVVTGTNGKSTTTAMLAAMTERLGSAACGNIGVAIYDALRDTQIQVLATELSSFQLHWAPNIEPDAGVLLNLAEDHIDWHGSYDNYATDKLQALRGKVAVFGADDEDVATFVDKLQQQGELADRVLRFSDDPQQAAQATDGAFDGYFVVNEQLVEIIGGQVTGLCSAEGISPAGRAGILDALAAASLARAAGAEVTDISRALAEFEVNAHRGQVVARTSEPAEQGTVEVQWIDDSKATNPHAADAALSGHERVVWVAGGQLKGADIVPLVNKHAGRIAAAVLIGQDAQQIHDALEATGGPAAKSGQITVIDDRDPHVAMEKAVDTARRYAIAAHSVSKQVNSAHTATVLLAPAAASLDMYTSMAQRGDLFAHYATESHATQ